MNRSDRRYLQPEHLRDRACTFEITEVTLEDLGADGPTERYPVLRFRETDQALVLSPAQRRTLVALFGGDVTCCVGQKVTLQAVRGTAADKEEEALDIVAISGAKGAPSPEIYARVLDYAHAVGRTAEAARRAIQLARGDERLALAFLEQE